MFICSGLVNSQQHSVFCPFFLFTHNDAFHNWNIQIPSSVDHSFRGKSHSCTLIFKSDRLQRELPFSVYQYLRESCLHEDIKQKKNVSCNFKTCNIISCLWYRADVQRIFEIVFLFVLRKKILDLCYATLIEKRNQHKMFISLFMSC